MIDEQATPDLDGDAITAVKEQGGGNMYRVTTQSGTIHSCPKTSRFGPNIQAWIDAGGIVEPEETAGEKLNRLLSHVKSSAGGRITGRLPEYKQRNLTARSAELLRIRSDNGLWTTEEKAEADAIQAEWDWVKQAREASNLIETDVKNGLITTEEGIDSDTRWPV